ncbi:nipped-B-like protein [Chloropicon primus]|uniref:Sister chromatid cohesion protein n=3 Tax=Chloropicon primus TaxID=1764295 RepID=A0A5B8MLY9_9CHLO|nr:nipped-B-like protein [Chloropicon primus]|eukprot:QDZ21459.1 nipped-B-like protein [Chloropicon primus]
MAERGQAPRRHVVSVLGTDPCISLPLLGARLDDDRAASSLFSSSSSGGGAKEVEAYEGADPSSREVQDRVFALLQRASVDYLKPKSKKYLKTATEGGFPFDAGNAKLSSLQEGILGRDKTAFDVTNAHYYLHSSQERQMQRQKPKRQVAAAPGAPQGSAGASTGRSRRRSTSSLKSLIRNRGACAGAEGGLGAIDGQEQSFDARQRDAAVANGDATEAAGPEDMDVEGEESVEEAGEAALNGAAGRSPRKFMFMNENGGRRRSNKATVLYAEDEEKARDKFFELESEANEAENLEAKMMETLRLLCDAEIAELEGEAADGGAMEEEESKIEALSKKLLSLSTDIGSDTQVSEAILGENLKLESNTSFFKIALDQLRTLISWGCRARSQEPSSHDKASGGKKSSKKKGRGAKAKRSAEEPKEGSGSIHKNASKLDLCLSSSRLALSLMILQGMPKFLYREEILEDMIGTIDAVFKKNVLSKVDAAMKSKIESSDSEEEGEGDGKAQESYMIEMALRHMEHIIPMMHLLMGRTKLPDTLALRLCRVLLDCFSVEVHFGSQGGSGREASRTRAKTRGKSQGNVESSLECVKRNSLVLIAVIFAKYPSFQDSLLTDIHSKCIRNGLKSQAHALSSIPRTFHLSANSSRIHLVSALIMFCIQNATVTADHKVENVEEGQEEGSGPPGGVLDGRTIRLRWADIVWQSIFQELVSSSSQSAKGGYVDRDQRVEWKQVLHHLLSDILTCFGNLEFPCSSLLLQRFTTLLMYKGLKHHDAFVRVASVELLGEIMGGLIRKEKFWKGDEFLNQDLETICESLVEAAPNASISDGGLLHAVEMMDMSSSAADVEKTLLDPKGVLQVAYDHFDAEQHGKGSSIKISISGNPHEACISMMHRAIDLALDSNMRILEEKRGILESAGHMLNSSAKSYLSEMNKRACPAPEDAAADEEGQPEEKDFGLGGLGGLGHMNSSVSLAIHRERAKNFDPVALEKICVYLSCTQTTVASRFGNFFDRLLDLCMSDIQEIFTTKSDNASSVGTTASSVQVRSKAMKVLADLCELDDGSLGLAQDPKVRACFDACIQDTSVSVREAAVDLISRFSSRSQELAMDYFDLIVHACGDPGTSVQKQAVKTLWETCAIPATFGRRIEAAASTAIRVSAMEDSVKVRTVKILRNFWFLTPRSLAEESLTEHFCETVWTIFEEQKRSRVSKNGLIVPFTRDHPVVHMLECIFNASTLDCSGQMKMNATEKASTLKSGRAFCRQLVDSVLHAEASALSEEEKSERILKYMVSLHALLVAEPKLCAGGNNQHYYIECLMPHLLYNQCNAGETHADGPPAKDVKRPNAEKLTCVLSIISSNILVIDVLGEQVCSTLTQNLQKLIASHDYLSVVAKACELLCRICSFSSATSEFIMKLTSSILDRLEEHISANQGQRSSTFLRRRLFVLGHLWRNYASSMESNPTSFQPILMRTIDAMISLLVEHNEKGETVVKSTTHNSISIEALRALGMVIYGHSKTALMEKVIQVYEVCLKTDAEPSLQVCALRGLTEMIKKEESTMLEKQQAQLKQQSKGSKHRASNSLDAVCGEGEVSIAGSVLRYFWEKSILPLALHVRGLEDNHHLGVPGLVELNSPLKLASMEIFDSVLRQGLVAPWTAVPSLVALCAFPNDMVHQQACRILRTYILEKRVDFFESKLIDAVAALQEQALLCGIRMGQDAAPDPNLMMSGIGKLYAMLRDRKQTRVAFLRSLLRSFTTKGIDLRKLEVSAMILIGLPYTLLEEPLQVVHSCISTVDQEATYVESNLELMQGCAEDIKAGRPVPIDLGAVGKKAGCLTLLLEVKNILRKAFNVTDNQLANYSERQKATRAMKVKGQQVNLQDFSGVTTSETSHAWIAQCKEFKKALKREGMREGARERERPSPVQKSEEVQEPVVPKRRKLFG